MSIAWSTIAFLVLLLPGFLFFIGLYLPENFTRETAPRTPLGQLAATVFIAFLVHGLVYAASWSVSVIWLPKVNLEHLLQVLQVEPLSDSDFAAVVADIQTNRWWILDYISVTSLLGLWFGYETGSMIVGGPFRRLAEHAWVYDLRIEGGAESTTGVVLKLLALLRWAQLHAGKRVPAQIKSAAGRLMPWWKRDALRTTTVAYVLTDITHQQRFMIYRGFLKAFGISKDGKPLYLVLSNAMRSYMLLADIGPKTSTAEGWHLIGSTSENAPALPGPRLSSYLVVSGDHINNVVFDRHSFEQTPAGLAALEHAYTESIKN